MLRSAHFALALCLSLMTLVASSLFADELSFNRDVRPILSDRCFHCHGPDAENQESEFRLDSRENATADLGGYAGIVPGDLDESELHARIRSEDDDRMPPEDAVRQLTDEERDILDRWIKEGAKFDKHWSFVPLPEKTEVPTFDGEANDGAVWARNEIDSFIYQGMVNAEMQPNVELEKEKWLRRVTFDLTGLPPTVEELKAFRDDGSRGAHATVVDRLLDSDACAERLASEWLDVARYSDTYGYQRDDGRFVWPYRDWVIGAFRENMPYHEFIKWQVAGDLLPNATRDQRLATTFNRLHSHKKEGGSSEEEFRVEMVSDRSHTFAAAFLGLTMECARCHDHKYDPLKTKEYYQLTSFFANIEERGLISFFTPSVPTPAMPLPSEKQEADLAAAAVEVKQAEEALKSAWAEEDPKFNEWLDEQPSIDDLDALPGLVSSLSFDEFVEGKLPDGARSDKPATTSKKNTLVDGHDGKAIRLTGDDAVDLPGIGHFKRHDPFSFSLWIKASDLDDRSVILRRSRAWDDAASAGYELMREGDRLNFKICHFWPGNAIAVRMTEPIETDRWYHVAVTYDGSSKAAGLKLYVDGTAEKTEVWKDHLTRDASTWGGYRDLAIGERFRDRGFKQGLVDELRVFDRQLSQIEVLRLSGAKAEATEAALKEQYGLTVSPAIRDALAAVRTAREKWNKTMDSIPAIMVMEELEQPRDTYVLNRGSYEDHGEKVTAETPTFLPPFPADAPRNRLGLVKWATDPNHPLTSRVTVNRYWQLMFGTGLVRTPEDFGLQGELPTHPELLDWLSRRFVESGWDVRALLRSMALSSTYRQSSVVSAEVRQQDPENVHYARGPSQRLSAEAIRDNVLAVSGLLKNKVGGAPVKPYDLPLAYNPIGADKGEGLYRRSLYTYWKRTSPAPVMMTMNANKRDVCRVRREVASSPLQSLVLLNGPQFVEASRVLGGRLLKDHGDDVPAMVEEAFVLLTSRSPTEREAEILQELFEEQEKHFGDKPEQAKELLSMGEAGNDKSLPQDRLAAATVLVNAMMNLDECVRLK